MDRLCAGQLLGSPHRFHATVTGVGGVFHETARREPLLVDARAANDMIRAAFDDEDRWSPPHDHLAVSPRDVLHKRAIPLPDGMRGRVEDSGRQAASASRGALRATLAVSDQKREGMSVPASWTHHATSENKLSASQEQEQRRPAADLGKLIDLPVPGDFVPLTIMARGPHSMVVSTTPISAGPRAPLRHCPTTLNCEQPSWLASTASLAKRFAWRFTSRPPSRTERFRPRVRRTQVVRGRVSFRWRMRRLGGLARGSRSDPPTSPWSRLPWRT